MKVVWISEIQKLTPTNANNFYRLKIPVDELKRIGVNCTIEEFSDPSSVTTADVVVFHRLALLEAGVAFRRELQGELGIACVAEYDNQYFRIPWHNPFYPRAADATRVVESQLRECDTFTTTTETLRRAFRPYSYRGHICPNCWDFTSTPLVEPTRRQPGEKFRIMFGGSNHHAYDLQLCLSGLRILMENRGDEIELISVGLNDPSAFGDLPWKHYPGIPDVPQYLSFLRDLRPHVGICPLLDNAFNRCKSPQKAYEYAGFGGAAPVCRNISPFDTEYRDMPALLVGRCQEWAECVGHLMDNEDVRLWYVRALQKIMIEKYDVRKRIGCWTAAFDAAIKHRKEHSYAIAH
jgi:hypothetical protein